MKISDELRRCSIDELMDGTRLEMELGGHGVTKGTLIKEAEELLNFIIDESIKALRLGQSPEVVSIAMAVQGIKTKTAEAIVAELATQ